MGQAENTTYGWCYTDGYFMGTLPLPSAFFYIKDLFVLFERQIYGEEETDLSSAGCNDQS